MKERRRSARRPGSPYPGAELLPRLVARLADLLVAALFASFIPVVGSILALVYLLLADGLPNGQSPGKRLLGVRVVHVPSRQPATVRQSIVRNLPIAIAFGLALSPWLALLAVPIALFEAHMLQSDPLGVRIGDVFADTQVIDTKIPLGTVDPVRRLTRAAQAALSPEVVEPAVHRVREVSCPHDGPLGLA